MDQDNKNLDQKCIKQSLLQIADFAFQQSKSVYDEKEQLFKSAILFDPDDISIRIFGRVNSKEQLQQQNQFFMQQSCLLMYHTVVHMQRLIGIGHFNDQQILSFLKTISVKQLGEDQWQLLYLQGFEEILHYEVDVDASLSKNTFEAFIKLWIKAREFSTEVDEQLHNSFIQNNYPNQRTGWTQIQVAIYYKSKDQLNSKFGKPKQEKYEDEDEACVVIKSKQIMTPQQLTNEYKIARVKQNQQICLIPDGKIFSGVFSQQNHLSLSRRTEFREINKPLLSQTQQFVQIHYIGELNLNLIPHGQGELVTKHNNFTITYIGGFKDGCFNGDGAEYRNGKLSFKGKYVNNYKNGEGCIPINDKKYIKGIFLCDRKNGIFETAHINKDEQLDTQDQIYYFKLDKLLDPNSPQDNLEIKKIINQQGTKLISENPSYQILQFYQISLSNFQIDSLKPGKWFNSSIIDAFIHLQYKFELLRRNNIIQYPYLIINVSGCQDIFSSVITSLNELNYKEFEKIYRIQQNKIQCKQFYRILFIFNYDRSHFLIFVYEYETLYQIDSMDCDRSVLYNLIVKLLIEFKYKVARYIRLPVSQQENYYDCGPYACFFAMQLLRKQYIIGGEQFKLLKIQQEQISRFRLHISRVLYQSSAMAYPI